MKKLLFLFALSLCSLAAWAYDFSAVAPSGQTLYYNITNSTAPRTVSVTFPGSLYSGSPWTGYPKPTGSLDIPSSVIYSGNTYLVTTIVDETFITCSGLTSVTIPNSVTAIGNDAFDGCSGLTNVTIGNSVTTIGDMAFIFCSRLISVIIGNSVTTIGHDAFSFCNALTSVTIPNSVTTIGNNAFYNCPHITSIVVESGNTIYDSRENCNAIIETATNKLLRGCTNTTIPNSVTTIESSAFENSMLTSVTIPNSVTTIESSAFKNCGMLTSVTIPNSVTTIGDFAFENCDLISVVIGNSVTSIGESAFIRCYNLKTVYNLSNLTFSKGSFSNGFVAYFANRVVNCTEHSGLGDNIIYKIPITFTIVDNDASTSETEIPYSTIPTNFIYMEGGGIWAAKNIVLTDGQDAFEAPETFTAETATYTREFTNSNRSTLYLPFTAAVPDNFEVYDFTSFANNTISFTEHTGDIAAYTPYLVGYDLSKDGNTTTCTITKTNAVFPKSVSANYHPVTHNDMTFSGVISRTQMTSTNNYGYSNGFFVQSGGSAHVNPFRCYFTYSPSGNAPQSLPPSLNVEVGYGDPVGIDAVETPEQEYDGRYGKDVYDMLGRLVRKNADNLEGLPRGIYIWKGKKEFKN